MRTLQTILLSAVAALAIAASAHAKPAPQNPPCPKPSAGWTAAPFLSPAPLWLTPLANDEFDSLAAMMRQRMAATMREMDEWAARAPLMRADAVNTGAGANFCAQSVEITRSGNGPAHVVRRSWGNCGGSQAPNATPSAHGVGDRSPATAI